MCYPPGIIYTTWGKMQKNAQNYYEQKEEGKERIYVIVLKRNLKLNYNVLKCFKNLNINIIISIIFIDTRANVSNR